MSWNWRMLKPVSRRELIRRMLELGFRGPVAGKRHAVMIRGNNRVPIPNPHQGDIDVTLLRRVLHEAEISIEDWDSVA